MGTVLSLAHYVTYLRETRQIQKYQQARGALLNQQAQQYEQDQAYAAGLCPLCDQPLNNDDSDDHEVRR